MNRKKIYIIGATFCLYILYVVESFGYLNFRPQVQTLEVVPKVAQQPLSEINPNISIEIRDLLEIVYALERYKMDNKSYPVSSSNGAQWDGIRSRYGESREDWIRGLVPEYIQKLPRDPRLLSDGGKQYIYSSNGASYKLIVHHPDNCDVIKAIYPSLVDPVRDCFAYGFWTEKFARW